uniref:Retrotransposon Copia-like N-terminal domain-containing protein n=1 Tax=Cannabis sativa TaxID=3483 RepID=A0A803NN97_CANSA
MATPGDENTPSVSTEGASAIQGTQPTRNGASSSQNTNPYPNQLTTLNQPFSLKLDRNNYTLWKTMVSAIVRGHRLHGYLTGAKECPPEFLPLGWLYSSMTESIATEVMGSASSGELWPALESLYGAYSKSKMDDTRTLIQTVRKGSTPMTEYLRQKKNWADMLAIAGDPYPEAHLVVNMLSGLDAEYLSIVVQIEARAKTTWQEL